MTSPETAAVRVLRGAEMLDRVVGEEWVDRVVSQAIDVARADDCILGQVFGSYQVGLTALGLEPGEQSADHGFTVSPAQAGGFDEINDAWRELLRSRRAE